MTKLDVMTYNILLGGRRGQPVRDVVRAVAPDVLLVNECPKTPVLWPSWRWNGSPQTSGHRVALRG